MCIMFFIFIVSWVIICFITDLGYSFSIAEKKESFPRPMLNVVKRFFVCELCVLSYSRYCKIRFNFTFRFIFLNNDLSLAFIFCFG